MSGLFQGGLFPHKTFAANFFDPIGIFPFDKGGKWARAGDSPEPAKAPESPTVPVTASEHDQRRLANADRFRRRQSLLTQKAEDDSASTGKATLGGA